MSNQGGLFERARDFIKGHPDQAQQGLDKLEEAVDQRTGGRYQDQIERGGEALGERLGLPETGVPGDPPAPPEPGQPVPPAPGQPTPTPMPGPPVPGPLPGEPERTDEPPVDPAVGP